MTNATQLSQLHPDTEKQEELEHAFSLIPTIEAADKYTQFDGFKIEGNQSLLPSAKDGKHVTFIYRLMLGSRSETLSEALAEWEMNGDRQVVMTADDLAWAIGPGGEKHPELKTKGSDVGPGHATKCLCGHDIYHVCEAYNPLTDNRLRIGNCCITKFLPPEISRQFNAATRARDNANKIKKGEGRLFSELTYNSLLGHYAAPKGADKKYAIAAKAKNKFPVTDLDNLSIGCLTYHFVDRLTGWATEDFENAFRAGRIDSAERDLLNEALNLGLDICTPADRVYKNFSWARAVTSLVASTGFNHVLDTPLQLQADANDPEKIIIRREATEETDWHRVYVSAWNPMTGEKVELKVNVYKSKFNPKGLLIANVIGGDNFSPGYWAVPKMTMKGLELTAKGEITDTKYSGLGIATSKPDSVEGEPGEYLNDDFYKLTYSKKAYKLAAVDKELSPDTW